MEDSIVSIPQIYINKKNPIFPIRVPKYVCTHVYVCGGSYILTFVF